MKKVIFDSKLIKKYDISGPRYTSYPTAPQFSSDFSEKELREVIATQKVLTSNKPISLYFHLPFCAMICYFCGCNKVITKNRDKSEEYLKYLFKEIEVKAPLIEKAKVSQVHFGGGTPTFLADDQLESLTIQIKKHFDWLDEGEFSIETDPRAVKDETIKLLAHLGFNRMSFGVQDFDLKVQKAVNRIQSLEITTAMVESARNYGFKSINLDLMYGLPFQNCVQFEKTLEKIIKIRPERISVFNYAHLPHLFKPQRRINEVDLPAPAEKLNMFKLATEKLLESGYVYIGMDHFAIETDELAIAQRNKKLNRNFQGYSTYPNSDLYAFGVSAISKIGDSFSQNQRRLDQYYQDIDDDKMPIFRGYQLNDDDNVRSQVIQKIMCDFELNFREIEQKYQLNFKDYFSKEMNSLKILEDDGLIKMSSKSIKVSDKGRILVRIIAMVFDIYLTDKSFTYSKAI